ncbi:hypothetical protein BS78_03G093200 [Paspalum vaginatum]|nr:hypothetical protein BS78_03G093200 [Paspalum vaginatum]
MGPFDSSSQGPVASSPSKVQTPDWTTELLPSVLRPRQRRLPCASPRSSPPPPPSVTRSPDLQHHSITLHATVGDLPPGFRTLRHNASPVPTTVPFAVDLHWWNAVRAGFCFGEGLPRGHAWINDGNGGSDSSNEYTKCI